jgi:hypothetical protein
VHPATLERHLATFARMGCTVISTRTFIAAGEAGRPLPPDSLVLHFDDGYLDNWLYAVPLLKRANVPATFFVSLDFIAPGDELRGLGGDCRGYMNWSEIRAIDADPLFEVEAHGVDHGRVPISDRQVDTLDARNWRSLAWVQWSRTPGSKHDWFLAETPLAVPLGSPVFESEGALAAPAFSNGAREAEQDFRRRIAANLDQLPSAGPKTGSATPGARWRSCSATKQRPEVWGGTPRWSRQTSCHASTPATVRLASVGGPPSRFGSEQRFAFSRAITIGIWFPRQWT